MRPTSRAPKMNPPYYKRHLGGENTSILCPTHHKKKFEKNAYVKFKITTKKGTCFGSGCIFQPTSIGKITPNILTVEMSWKPSKKYITRKQRVLLGGGAIAVSGWTSTQDIPAWFLPDLFSCPIICMNCFGEGQKSTDTNCGRVGWMCDVHEWCIPRPGFVNAPLAVIHFLRRAVLLLPLPVPLLDLLPVTALRNPWVAQSRPEIY